MKIFRSHSRRQEGFALLMVLIIAGISIIILAGAMYRNHTVAMLNQRNNEYHDSCIAAEAAVEKVFARMAYDFQAQGIGVVSNNLAMYRTNYPTTAENSALSKYIFSDTQGNQNRTHVNYAYTYSGSLPSAYQGLFTIPAPVYRIVSNVQITNSKYQVVGTAQEDVLLAMVPLNTWAIFYNGLLEFSTCADMIVNGPVMANGKIYVGTTASLTFNNGVACTDTLTAPLVNGKTSGWTPSTPSSWNTDFNANPAYSTNQASVTVSLNMTNSHFMIDMPPGGEDPTSLTGRERLYNKAQLVLIVTNSISGTNPTVKLTIQSSVNGAVPGADPYKTELLYTNVSAISLKTNLPFLSLTNFSYDRRETATNYFTQIDVGRLATWMSTNTAVQNKLPSYAGAYPSILYVADQRPLTDTRLPAVRLVNGAQLPANNGVGFSVATQNPLYVWGDYNVQTASSAADASAGSTDTTYTVPAALFSDALTILSDNWNDIEGFQTYSQSSSTFDAAAAMTINAAIVTGTVASTGSSGTTFSGGVHNLPRMLEDWSSSHLWLNTSILRLWSSNMATNQFRNPAGFNPSPINPYYNPPTRHFSFDQNYLDPSKVPPGIPVALVPIRFGWGVPPPATSTYTPDHN